jgi:hypothetical protein
MRPVILLEFPPHHWNVAPWASFWFSGRGRSFRGPDLGSREGRGRPPCCSWPETAGQTVLCEQESCGKSQHRTDNTLNKRLSDLSGTTDHTETRQATSQRSVLRSAVSAASAFQPESTP